MELDEQKALVRKWFQDLLLRNPKNQAELDLHVWAFATKGAEACIVGIVDSAEGQAVLKKRRGAVGLS